MVFYTSIKDKGGLSIARRTPASNLVDFGIDPANLDTVASLAGTDGVLASVANTPKLVGFAALASSLQALAVFALAGHNHDAVYSKLGHAHVQADVTGLKTTDTPTFANLNATAELRTAGVRRIDAAGAAALTLADIDNLRLDGNTLSTLNANGHMLLSPNGTGKVGVKDAAPFGTFDINGSMSLNGGLINTSARPALSTVPIAGEVRGYSSAGTWSNDGFFRASAGGGTGTYSQSGIDITGYSTISEVNNTVLLYTAGTERMRAWNNGYIGIATQTPQAPLHVVGDITLTGGLYVGGSPSAKGTPRLDASGNAALATATIGSAKCWGRVSAWPASTNDGDFAYNTTLRKWGHYNAGTSAWEAWS